MKIRLIGPRGLLRRASLLGLVLLLGVLSGACAAGRAYRSGQRNSDRGDWDAAVARFTMALKESPKNITYKIALENARIQASRAHVEKARKQLQAGNFDKAVEEYQIAAGYDPSNEAARNEVKSLKARIEKLAADKRQAKELATRRTTDVTLPVPFLSPRSPVPIKLSMTAPLEKIYQTLGTLVGVNVVFDPDMQGKDRTITANLTGVSFQEALDQIGLVNRKAYRVLDRNTILIIDDTNPQTRQRWDDQVMRTFYLENIEVKDVEAVLRTALGPQAKVTKNDATNALTVISTLDEMALASRFIRSNDKPRGEILVEVEILEINRTKAKEYGLQLSSYQAGVELQPTGVAGEVAGGLTNLRAHLLSSLNAADWVVQIPSALFAKFLQDESTVKILSSPKVRAFEGKKAIFNVGTDVPIPQFYPGYSTGVQPGVGVGGYGGSTSAQYRTVGVNMEIDKARVTAGDEVTMEFKAEFSLIGEDKVFGTGLNQVNYPQFLSRKIENTLRLSDGVTAVIGGLLGSREARALKGAIGVDSIPFLNKVLGGHTNKDEEVEILISLTPHILRAPTVLLEDVEPLYLGLRNNLRIPGVRPLFGPEEVQAEGSELSRPQPATPDPLPGPSPAPQSAGTPRPQSAPATPLDATPIPQGSPVPPLPGSPPTPPNEGTPRPQSTPTTPPAATPTAQGSPVPPPSAAVTPTESALSSRSAWDRTEVQMKVGEIQRVALNLFNVRSVKEVTIAVRADSPALEFVEIGPGQLLSVDGVQVLTERQMTGARASAQFNRTTPLSGGTGAVAVIGFRASRPGEVTIFVESLSLSSGQEPRAVPLAGAVRVTVVP